MQRLTDSFQAKRYLRSLTAYPVLVAQTTSSLHELMFFSEIWLLSAPLARPDGLSIRWLIKATCAPS